MTRQRYPCNTGCLGDIVLILSMLRALYHLKTQHEKSFCSGQNWPNIATKFEINYTSIPETKVTTRRWEIIHAYLSLQVIKGYFYGPQHSVPPLSGKNCSQRRYIVMSKTLLFYGREGVTDFESDFTKIESITKESWSWATTSAARV